MNFSQGEQQIRQFARDWNGVSAHLHIRAPHYYTDEILKILDEYNDDEENVSVSYYNLRYYMGNENLFASALAKDFDCVRVRSISQVVVCMEQDVEDELSPNRIIFLQNAELLTSFRYKSIRQLFAVCQDDGAEKFKIVTQSFLAWPIITANLNIEQRLSTATTEISIRAATDEEKIRILISEFKYDDQLVRVGYSQLKEKLSKVIAVAGREGERVPLTRLQNIAKELVDADNSVLPAISILTHIAAYFAIYNPANLDEQLLDINSTGSKRRRVECNGQASESASNDHHGPSASQLFPRRSVRVRKPSRFVPEPRPDKQRKVKVPGQRIDLTVGGVFEFKGIVRAPSGTRWVNAQHMKCRECGHVILGTGRSVVESHVERRHPEVWARVLAARSPAERHTPGLCGLQNLGNTCFMNSALQCLSNVPELTEYFLDNRHCSEVNASNVLGTGGRLCYAYANLIKDMWKGTMSSVKPYSFKNVIGQFAPRFNGYNQQDSQELMAYLLDELHEDLNRIHNKPYVEEKESDGRPDQVVAEEAWSDYKKRNDSIIVDLMHGQLKSTVVCLGCYKVSVKFDPVCYLSLPVPEPLAQSTIILIRGRNWQKFSISHNNRTTTRQVTKLIGDEVGIDTKSPQQQIVLLPSYAQTAFLLNPEAPIPVVQYSMYAQPRVFYAYVVDTTETVAIIMNLRSSTFGKQLTQPLVTNFRTPLTFENILKQALPFVEATSWRQRNNQNDEDEDSAVSFSSSSQGVRLCSRMTPGDEQAIHSVSIESTSAANPTEEAKFTQLPKPLRISLKWNTSLNFSHPAQLEPEKATELNVPMSERGYTLDDCVDTFCDDELLQMWKCPKCKTQRRAFKKLDLWKLPKIVIIHLKRFQYSRYSRDKIDTEITIPVQNYQLGSKVDNSNHDMAGYDLIAISNHMGGLDSGHYTAKALLKTNNRWCDFNDSCASVSSGTMPSEITSREAYLLVYRRRDAHSDELNNGGQNISPMQSPMRSPQRPLRPRRRRSMRHRA